MQFEHFALNVPDAKAMAAWYVENCGMREHGYTESDCKKFLGGNFYRVFKQVWR